MNNQREKVIIIGSGGHAISCIEEIESLIIKNKKEYEYQPYQKLTLDELQITKNTLIFDTRYSENFCKSRVKQSTWLNRSNLKDYDNLNDEKIIYGNKSETQ